MNRVLIMTLPFLLVACGKASKTPAFGDASLEEAAASVPADGSNIQGRYKAEFITLNTSVNGFLTTNAYILRKDDAFHVQLKLSGGAPNVWHKQDIHVGWRCPTPNDDKNGDGLIDVEEGRLVWGDPIIPLDTDLTTQKSGENVYPVADHEGTYQYKRTVSFQEMFKDLKAPTNPNEPYRKLQGEEGLPLEGNVLVILGTDEKANLPATVATADGLTTQASFPVACALIRRVGSDPGTFESDSGEFGNPDVPPTTTSEPTPAPTPGPETSPTPGNDNGDGDSEDWDDRIRRWWRRTWNGGGN